MLTENQDYAGRQKPYISRKIHSYSGWSSMVKWEKTRVLPASHSSPPTQLSTLLTLDLLHIKEPSLEKPSHMHRKIQGGRTRELGEREGGGKTEEGEGDQSHSTYRSIIQNKSIPAVICLTWQDLGKDQAEHTRNSQCAKRLLNELLC